MEFFMHCASRGYYAERFPRLDKSRATDVSAILVLSISTSLVDHIPSVSWQRTVTTDPLEFAITLTNQVSAQASSHTYTFRPLNGSII